MQLTPGASTPGITRQLRASAVHTPTRHARPPPWPRTRAGTTAGQDLNLSLDRVNSNRNFTNKLWNAGKFILFQLDGVCDEEWGRLAGADFSSSSSSDWQGLCLTDRWVISALHQVGQGVGPGCCVLGEARVWAYCSVAGLCSALSLPLLTHTHPPLAPDPHPSNHNNSWSTA